MAGSTQGAVTAEVARPQGARRPTVRAGAPAPTPRKELEAQRELRAMLPHLFPAAPPPAPTSVDVQKVLPWLSETWPGYARPAEVEAAKAQIVERMRGVLADAGYAEPGALAVSPGVDAALGRMVAAAVQAKKAGLGGLLTDTPVVGELLHDVDRAGVLDRDRGIPPGALADGVATFGPNNLGFNAPRVMHYETTGEEKYGDTPNVLRDLAALGATYFRQPTGVDLTWPSSGGAPARVPVQSGDGEEIYQLLDDFGVVDNLTTMFELLILENWGPKRAGRPETNLKVVLTFLNVQSPHSGIKDPLGDFWDPKSGPAGGDTIVQLPWAEDHAGQSVTWWDGTDYAFESVAGILGADRTLSSTFGSDQILFEGLDPRSPYKLVYVYLIARAFARVLIEVQRRIKVWWIGLGEAVAPSIFDYILGIELCNEVNVKNLVVSGADLALDASAYLWMHVAWEAMRGFQQALAEEGESVEFWLPSLWSYPEEEPPDVDHTPQRFSDVLLFDTWLATWLAGQGAVDRGLATPFTVDATCIANQDYHFYHYEDQSGAAILRLRAEVVALRAALRVLRREGRASPTVSVSETGASTHGEDVAEDFRWIFEYCNGAFRAGLGVPVDDTWLRRFQAREVWRRLAVAGCDVGAAAWHTHMANTDGGFDTGNFRDMGVRKDNQPDGKDPFGASLSTAVSAETRPAYWAFQRLATLLRNPDTGGWRGRLLDWSRSKGAEADYYQHLDTSSADDMLVLLEFDLGSGVPLGIGSPAFRYAYLVFLDPSYAGVEPYPAGWDSHVFRLRVDLPGGAVAVRVPTVPESILPGAGTATEFPTDTPASDGGDWVLDGADWSRARSEVFDGQRLDLYVNGPEDAASVDQTWGDPVLILCTGQLEFAPWRG